MYIFMKAFRHYLSLSALCKPFGTKIQKKRKKEKKTRCGVIIHLGGPNQYKIFVFSASFTCVNDNSWKNPKANA
jgi:hypothetical protein